MKTTALALAATVLTASTAMAQDGFALTLGFGPSFGPAYFGSDEFKAGPTGTLRLHALSFGPARFGDPDSRDAKLGFGLRGAFGFVAARKAKDYPELAGLTDIDPAIELGLGIGYEAQAWRVFADVRHGVTGHHGTVGVLGGDLKLRVSEQFSVSIGPRATFGSDGYVDTYFGVTPAESVASGLAAFDPKAGLVSAGAELAARYELGNDWGLEGKITYSQFQADALDSPIVRQGRDSSTTVSMMLTRRFTFGF